MNNRRRYSVRRPGEADSDAWLEVEAASPRLAAEYAAAMWAESASCYEDRVFEVWGEGSKWVPYHCEAVEVKTYEYHAKAMKSADNGATQ